jgi:MOSC domain-containing protein YiiM
MSNSAVDATRGDADRGATATKSEHGKVAGLHRKAEVAAEHGLPKPTVPEARIRRAGLEGDFNRYRHEEKHDDEGMAVLIVPRETLEQLNREGWPVRPGDLGENISSVGVPYDAFVPGRRLRVGEVELEVSKACTPCDNLYLLPYVGTRRGPEFVKTMLDRRGWYARVVKEGTVHVGDPIELPA